MVNRYKEKHRIVPRRFRKKLIDRRYPCEFCNGEHTHPGGRLYCKMNPDADANRKSSSEKAKVSYYEKGVKEAVMAGYQEHREEIVAASSARMKKIWKSDKPHPIKYDRNGANHPMYGRKQTEKFFIAQAEKVERMKHSKKSLDLHLEKANIVAPVIQQAISHDFFTVLGSRGKEAWAPVRDSDGFDDEFDPFS